MLWDMISGYTSWRCGRSSWNMQWTTGASPSWRWWLNNTAGQSQNQLPRHIPPLIIQSLGDAVSSPVQSAVKPQTQRFWCSLRVKERLWWQLKWIIKYIRKKLWFPFIFTAQCTLVHMRGLGIACRPSVRLSVTLVDCDHISWKSWKLIARAISPTPSLFVAKSRSTYSQGNMGKFGGD